MIEFDMSYYYDDVPGDKETLKTQLDNYGEQIKSLFSGISKSHIEIGCLLTELLKSKCYAFDVQAQKRWNGNVLDIVPGKFRGNVCHSFYISYCQNTLGLDKSQLSRYLNVVDEFVDIESKSLKDEWKNFSFSQLVEMLTLTPEQRKKVQAKWTVKEIRAYKSSLVATSQQTKPSVRSVATSQPNEEDDDDSADSRFERKAILFTLQRYPKYERFYGFTPKRLCDDYMELEQKYNELQKEVERLKSGEEDDDLDDDTESQPEDRSVIRRSGLSKTLAAIVG